MTPFRTLPFRTLTPFRTLYRDMDTMTIEDLAEINPQRLEEPVDWSIETAQERIEKFKIVVERILGEVSWFGFPGECTIETTCTVSIAAKAVTQNKFIAINLSKFNRLFTILYAWDMKRDYLDRLVTALEKAGFKYVPFTLFTDPVNYRWEYEDEFGKNLKALPEGKNVIRHEDIFNSLFGYL